MKGVRIRLVIKYGGVSEWAFVWVSFPLVFMSMWILLSLLSSSKAEGGKCSEAFSMSWHEHCASSKQVPRHHFHYCHPISCISSSSSSSSWPSIWETTVAIINALQTHQSWYERGKIYTKPTRENNLTRFTVKLFILTETLRSSFEFSCQVNKRRGFLGILDCTIVAGGSLTEDTLIIKCH